MDQIGIVCKSPEEGFRMLSTIAGYDNKDGTMVADSGKLKAAQREQANVGKSDLIKIGVPVNVFAMNADDSAAAMLAKSFETVEFDLKYYDVYEQVMQILCSAELSNNISRYDGIKFGHRAKDYNGLNELYKKSRSEAFGADVKLVAVIGAMVLSQENYKRYYDKAMRLRRMIKESLEFDRYDAIVLPSHNCNAISRLCGLPAVTTPEFTLIADAGRENILEKVLKSVESGTKGDAI
jgi:aspartyl-tRNA(Asn)/glutamyl-tRNA(Gln) amidotransferase subunit A